MNNGNTVGLEEALCALGALGMLIGAVVMMFLKRYDMARWGLMMFLLFSIKSDSLERKRMVRWITDKIVGGE